MELLARCGRWVLGLGTRDVRDVVTGWQQVGGHSRTSRERWWGGAGGRSVARGSHPWPPSSRSSRDTPGPARSESSASQRRFCSPRLRCGHPAVCPQPGVPKVWGRGKGRFLTSHLPRRPGLVRMESLNLPVRPRPSNEGFGAETRTAASPGSCSPAEPRDTGDSRRHRAASCFS